MSVKEIRNNSYEKICREAFESVYFVGENFVERLSSWIVNGRSRVAGKRARLVCFCISSSIRRRAPKVAKQRTSVPAIARSQHSLRLVVSNDSNKRKMNAVAVKPGRGRGMKLTLTGCQCFRPKSIVLCTNCGFRTWGRVRYSCPSHPQTVFLFDFIQCPHCKAYESMLCEFNDSP